MSRSSRGFSEQKKAGTSLTLGQKFLTVFSENQPAGTKGPQVADTHTHERRGQRPVADQLAVEKQTSRTKAKRRLE